MLRFYTLVATLLVPGFIACSPGDQESRTGQPVQREGAASGTLASNTGAPTEVDDWDKLLETGQSLYSQEKSELVIRHFFRDRRDGFFLDVGCFLPKKYSTTYYLEQHLGWSGIAVDAQQQLAPRWKRDRPRSKFFGFAVTDKSGEIVTFFQAGGVSALDIENIEKWERVRKREIPEKKIEVATMTIDDILQGENVEAIDFLSMDINGSEPTALKAFDIQKYHPELVHIEVHKKNEEVLRDYFERNGYRRINKYLKYDRNWYFTPDS